MAVFWLFILKILLIGCCGGFTFAFLPALFWPHRVWIWWVGFPIENPILGTGIILSLILGHGDQLQAAMFWFGVGSAIASLSFCGPKLAPFITIKRSWPWI
jgi:hypothetical protein